MQQSDALDLTTLDDGYSSDPYALYAVLQREAPVRRVVFDGLPAWLVTRHEDVRRAMLDPRLSHDLRSAGAAARTATWPFFEEFLGMSRHMLRADPPDHTRLRRLVGKAFTPGRIQALRPRAEQMAETLIAQFLPRGRADLIGEFAHPFPIMVIAELLGVPEEDRPEFRRWADVSATAPPEQAHLIVEAYGRVRDYLASLVERKGRQSNGDAEGAGLLSALAAVRDEGQRLDEQELLSMAYLLLTAGFETTVDLIGNGTLALLRRPDQMAALRADPSLIAPAIEELLRYDGPIEIGIVRFTTSEIDIGGTVIPGGGEAVLLSLAGADRDPSRFPDADRIDIHRRDPGHLAFGHGIHFCLGAPLARMEGVVAFGALLRRCPDLALAVDPADLPWRHNPHLRGLEHLPVTFTSTMEAEA